MNLLRIELTFGNLKGRPLPANICSILEPHAQAHAQEPHDEEGDNVELERKLFDSN